MSAGAFEYLTAAEVAACVPAAARRLCLVAASYAGSAGISDDVVRLIRALAPEFDAVVLLLADVGGTAASGAVGEADRRRRLPAHCRVRVVPNHAALDFAMWARVLHAGGLRRDGWTRVALVNDSCTLVGAGFAGVFETARVRGFEFWGLTENTEIAPHLQSFFLVAEGAAAVARLLAFFAGRDMDRYAAASKATVVRDLEVGLSRHMAERFPPRAAFPLRRLDAVLTACAHRAGARNYAYAQWDVLLAVGCPLLKRNRRQLTADDAAVVRALTDAA